ncbi:MAG: heme-binding protein, partial [Alphaproteobacteria bacterium]
MKSIASFLLATLGACSLSAAVAELNPATGIIETPDGTFTARDFTIVDGFRLELLHVVPTGGGSWFPMTWDSRGRLIVSSHNSEQMYRLTIPSLGSNAPVRVEPIDLPIGSAHGLLYAFDTLFVTVNNGQNNRSGVYRVTDTDGDDRFDQIRVIRNINGGGQHGQHTLKMNPDGRHISLIVGDDVPVTTLSNSRVPQIWGEDDLIRTVANNFNNYQLAPQAWIALFDPTDTQGNDWTLWAMGMRNPVDHAYNKDGEMFTYDADHELDMGDPWYRPTAVHHVTSGSDFGFRLRGSKHPFYYADYHAPLAIIGAGSPTGNTFGTGTKFPARYQDAFFINDSSYGNVWAIHMTPQGSTYQASVAPFVSGRPFGVYGSLANPADGTLLLTTGSALYRVSYGGSESTQPTQPDQIYADRRELRRSLE